MLIFFILAVALFATSSANDYDHEGHRKNFYVCPPNFIRLGNKCYFFSNSTTTWQEAYFRCKDLRSNLAVIKSSHQNKILRNALNKEGVEPVERWIGGYYDWSQKEWKWAPSGKPMNFQGFSHDSPKEGQMDWQKAVMDPKLAYKWTSKSAIEYKHYICQTNLKTVNTKEKKKLQKVYKADDENNLNAIPVPEIYDPSVHLPNDIDPNQPMMDKNDPLYGVMADVIGQADIMKKSKEERLRRKKLREEIKKKREEKKRQRELQRQRKKQSKKINSTLNKGDVDTKNKNKKRNRRKGNGHKYHADKSTETPLLAQKIVEDFSDWKLGLSHPASEAEKN